MSLSAAASPFAILDRALSPVLHYLARPTHSQVPAIPPTHLHPRVVVSSFRSCQCTFATAEADIYPRGHREPNALPTFARSSALTSISALTNTMHMIEDMTDTHLLPIDVGSSSSATTSPAVTGTMSSEHFHIKYKTKNAHLALNVRNSIRGKGKLIQWNLRLLQIPQKSKFALQ